MARLSALIAGVSASLAAAWSIDMTVRPSGSSGPITGTVKDVPAGAKYTDYKLAILTSADGGKTWWDKSHSPYFLAWTRGEMANPGELQNAAVVIKNDWSFTLQGYAASPYDATSDLWRAYLVPASYDMKWPEYQIEGVPMPGGAGSPAGVALCFEDVTKAKGRIAGGPLNGGNAPAPAPPAPAPAASPSGKPAASPAAPSPAAPSPAAPSPAAPAPSTAASPAASSALAAPSVEALPAASPSDALPPVTSGAGSLPTAASLAAAIVAVGVAAVGLLSGA